MLLFKKIVWLTKYIILLHFHSKSNTPLYKTKTDIHRFMFLSYINLHLFLFWRHSTHLNNQIYSFLWCPPSPKSRKFCFENPCLTFQSNTKFHSMPFIGLLSRLGIFNLEYKFNLSKDAMTKNLLSQWISSSYTSRHVYSYQHNSNHTHTCTHKTHTHTQSL